MLVIVAFAALFISATGRQQSVRFHDALRPYRTDPAEDCQALANAHGRSLVDMGAVDTGLVTDVVCDVVHGAHGGVGAPCSPSCAQRLDVVVVLGLGSLKPDRITFVRELTLALLEHFDLGDDVHIGLVDASTGLDTLRVISDLIGNRHDLKEAVSNWNPAGDPAESTAELFDIESHHTLREMLNVSRSDAERALLVLGHELAHMSSDDFPEAHVDVPDLQVYQTVTPDEVSIHMMPHPSFLNLRPVASYPSHPVSHPPVLTPPVRRRPRLNDAQSFSVVAVPRLTLLTGLDTSFDWKVQEALFSTCTVVEVDPAKTCKHPS